MKSIYYIFLVSLTILNTSCSLVGGLTKSALKIPTGVIKTVTKPLNITSKGEETHINEFNLDGFVYSSKKMYHTLTNKNNIMN